MRGTRNALALTLVVFGCTGCRTWRAIPGPVVPALDSVRDRQARVVLAIGGTLRLRDARVIRDSVAVDAPRLGNAVAVADLRRVEVRAVSITRSVLAVAGGALLAVAGYLGLLALTYPPT